MSCEAILPVLTTPWVVSGVAVRADAPGHNCQARPDRPSSNVPLMSLFLLRYARSERIPYVFWRQDVYSEAIGMVARQRMGSVGPPVGGLPARMSAILRAIGRAIVPHHQAVRRPTQRVGHTDDKVQVIPNWAAIDEIDKPATRQRLGEDSRVAGSPVVMYAGTLGLKHDPAMLATSPPGQRRPTSTSSSYLKGLGREWWNRMPGGEPRFTARLPAL